MNAARSILFLLLVSLSSGANAMTVGGIEVPTQKDGLELCGAGLLRKGFIFKIYVGALYIDKAYDGERMLDSVAKRIDIHYFHNTPKKHMIRVANETLRKNLSAQEYKNLLPKIEKLHNAYVDGKKGSYASIIHRPGKGFTYLFDGEAIVTIDSDRFANAYFSIWIGEHPSSETVKEAMLKGAKG